MSTLIEKIQQKLGYQPLQKIDPNTQDLPKASTNPDVADLLPQGAEMAVVAGLYKSSRQDDPPLDYTLENIFGDTTNDVVAMVAKYASVGTEKAKTEMQKVADAAQQIINEEVPDANAEKIKTYYTNQRTDILMHLPPDLRMGDIFHENTVDDQTNKMEGPVSNFMHGIEKIFSSDN